MVKVLMLSTVALLILTACNGETIECETDEVLIDEECISEETLASSHYWTLRHEGRDYYVDAVDYTYQSDPLLDYSDDERTLFEWEDVADDEVLDFPCQAFEEALREELDIDEKTPITYGDVKDITSLRVTSSGIESIAGIEYFQSLRTLTLDNNPALTSLNGIQALDDLDTLYARDTSVRTLDYELPSITTIDMRHSRLDLEPETISQMPELSTLNARQTMITLDEDLFSAFEAFDEATDHPVKFLTYYLQVDWSELDTEDFWVFDDGDLEGYNMTFDVDVTADFVDAEFPDSMEGFGLDIEDKAHGESLNQAALSVLEAVDIQEDMDAWQEIILIYDYLYHHFAETASPDETNNHILRALEGEPTTHQAASEALAYVLGVHGFDVRHTVWVLQEYGVNELDARGYVIEIFKDDVQYLIDLDYALLEEAPYSFFLVSYDTYNQRIEEASPPVFEELYPHNSHDYDREALIEKAEALNITLEFDEVND